MSRTDSLISTFVNQYSIDFSIVLLQILADPSQGGQGYSIQFFDPYFFMDWDGWEVDKGKKIICIEVDHRDSKKAEFLKEAIEVEFLKTKSGFASRLLWGSAKVVGGTVEGIIGAIGIVVPEPGTTVGGAVMLGLGVNTAADGVTQIFGGNNGRGFNLLGTAAGAAGKRIAEMGGGNPETGRMAGEVAFLVTSLAAGSLASIKIIKAPGTAIFARGVGGQPGGLQVGRLDLLFKSGRANDGMTIISINNNANKSILRFVTHSGRLMVNGRIYGQQRVLRHATNPKEILKGLLKLMAHGSKF